MLLRPHLYFHEDTEYHFTLAYMRCVNSLLKGTRFAKAIPNAPRRDAKSYQVVPVEKAAIHIAHALVQELEFNLFDDDYAFSPAPWKVPGPVITLSNAFIQKLKGFLL